MGSSSNAFRERGFFTDNLLVRIHFIIVMIRWTGLAGHVPLQQAVALQRFGVEGITRGRVWG